MKMHNMNTWFVYVVTFLLNQHHTDFQEMFSSPSLLSLSSSFCLLLCFFPLLFFSPFIQTSSRRVLLHLSSVLLHFSVPCHFFLLLLSNCTHCTDPLSALSLTSILVLLKKKFSSLPLCLPLSFSPPVFSSSPSPNGSRVAMDSQNTNLR